MEKVEGRIERKRMNRKRSTRTTGKREVTASEFLLFSVVLWAS